MFVYVHQKQEYSNMHALGLLHLLLCGFSQHVWPSLLTLHFSLLLQERRGAERRTGFGAAVSSLYQEEMIRYLDISEMKSTDILTQALTDSSFSSNCESPLI